MPSVDAIQLHGRSIEDIGPRLHVHLITVASAAARAMLAGRQG